MRKHRGHRERSRSHPGACEAVPFHRDRACLGGGPDCPLPHSIMRLAAIGLLALAFALPTQAQTLTRQQVNRPSLRSTFVVPSHNGEARRVTTYARRPAQQGRLARRYRGLRANRTVRSTEVGFVRMPVRAARPIQRTVRTPRHAFVRQGGSYYQVLPRR